MKSNIPPLFKEFFEKILNKIGFKLNFVLESDSQIVYTLESK